MTRYPRLENAPERLCLTKAMQTRRLSPATHKHICACRILDARDGYKDDCVVRDAVASEPVSGRISLLNRDLSDI